MSKRSDYAAFSALSSALAHQEQFCSYRWTGHGWEVGFGPVRCGLFAGLWETRTGRDLVAVCADVRAEVGA